MLLSQLWNVVDVYLRRWKRFDSNQSRRRILLILCVCLLFLYNGPAICRWLWNKTPILIDENVKCVEREINLLMAAASSRGDVHLWKSYDEFSENKELLAYVGNGKFGFSVSKTESDSFYILGKRALETVLPFYPFIDTEYPTTKFKSALLINFFDGIAHRVTCFKSYSKSASILETFYAHRFISSLFVQEIRITNPSDVPLVLNLKRKGWTGTNDVVNQHMVLSHSNVEYYQYQGQCKTIDNDKEVEFIIAAPIVPDTLSVDGQSQKTLNFQTFLNYTKPGKIGHLTGKIPELKASVRETVKKVLEMSPLTLRKDHSNAWRNIWQSGFGISYSKADGFLNGDVINATLYYILSHKSAFADDKDVLTTVSGTKDSKTYSLLSRPDSCYNGHSTIQASSLWSDLNNVQNVNRIVNLWLLTLENQGCHNLVEAGAEGTMQALILSLGPFQFTKFHVKFNAQPRDLHRDYFIRRLRYGNTFLNISVTLGDDNKASISVSVDKNEEKKRVFACDGGCLDSPVELSSQPQIFPVKLTEPPTAILYITFEKTRLEEFKHSLHVKEVAVAPAHEHNLIALHRHGHQLGGLPALFWVSIVFLIVVFHLFLIKLIYNEYCGGSSSAPTSERVRYAV